MRPPEPDFLRTRFLTLLVERQQLFDAHAFRFALEVHDDAVSQHGQRNGSHVVDVRHGASVHRGTRLGA